MQPRVECAGQAFTGMPVLTTNGDSCIVRPQRRGSGVAMSSPGCHRCEYQDALVEHVQAQDTALTLNRPGFGGGSLVESQATRLIRSPSSYRASNSVGGLPPQAP